MSHSILPLYSAFIPTPSYTFLSLLHSFLIHWSILLPVFVVILWEYRIFFFSFNKTSTTVLCYVRFLFWFWPNRPNNELYKMKRKGKPYQQNFIIIINNIIMLRVFMARTLIVYIIVYILLYCYFSYFFKDFIFLHIKKYLVLRLV